MAGQGGAVSSEIHPVTAGPPRRSCDAHSEQAVGTKTTPRWFLVTLAGHTCAHSSATMEGRSSRIPPRVTSSSSLLVRVSKHTYPPGWRIGSVQFRCDPSWPPQEIAGMPSWPFSPSAIPMTVSCFDVRFVLGWVEAILVTLDPENKRFMQ